MLIILQLSPGKDAVVTQDAFPYMWYLCHRRRTPHSGNFGLRGPGIQSIVDTTSANSMVARVRSAAHIDKCCVGESNSSSRATQAIHVCGGSRNVYEATHF